MDSCFESLQEQRRLNITNELRRCIELEKNFQAIKVVRPKFNKQIIPRALIREGAGELALRTGDAGLLCTSINTNVVIGRPDPPLADEDLNAICQAIYKGVRWSGVGTAALEVCGDEQGSRCS